MKWNLIGLTLGTSALLLASACGESAAPAGQTIPDIIQELPPLDTSPADVPSDTPTPDVTITEDVPDTAEPEVIEPDVAPDAAEPDATQAPDCDGQYKEAGCACSNADECESKYCLLSSQGKVCADYCIDSCPEGWQCLPVALPGAGADVQFLCVERSVYLCQPCESNGDCAALGFEGMDKCVDYGEAGSYCGIDCSETACPSGYECNEDDQCVASSGECSCQPLHIQLEAKTGCQVTNDLGTCAGERFCGEDGLTACDTPGAQPEVCDGLDNDCDGEVDEVSGSECIITN